MPRAIWNGAISFGLVNIPVRLYPATRRRSVSFNQLDARTGSRIRYQKVSAADGSPVPPEHIVKGWEHASGQYVVIDDQELAALAPNASRSIEIEAVVELSEIDPVLFDSAYYLGPGEGFAKPYALLLAALDETDRVAIARFVRANKQYLAAIRPNQGKLDLSTMVFTDELVDAGEIAELDEVARVELSSAELAMAHQLVEALATPFDPAAYRDTHREQLLALLDAKAAGQVLSAPAVADDGDDGVVDLLAALEASVAAARATRSTAETNDDAGRRSA